MILVRIAMSCAFFLEEVRSGRLNFNGLAFAQPGCVADHQAHPVMNARLAMVAVGCFACDLNVGVGVFGRLREVATINVDSQFE